MKTLNETLDYINTLEKTYSPSEFDFFGDNYWPIIRNELIKNSNNLPLNNSPKKTIKGLFSLFYNLFKILDLFKINGKALMLTYANNPSGIIKIDNSFLDKQWSPFISKYGSDNVKLLEFGFIYDLETKLKGVLNISPLFFLFKYPIKIILHKRSNKISKKISKIFKNDNNLNSAYLANILSLKNEFLEKKMFFKILFFFIKPKFLFVKSFNNINSFAIVSAANCYKIKTIEYQHGQQGENSLNYSNWFNIPASGYNMFPKYFWVWDHIFADKFHMWMSNQRFHRVFIGRNLWFDFVKNNKNIFKPIILESNRLKILVCLQNKEISELIINSIKNSSENTIWYIRVHPRHKSNYSWLIQLLKKNRINDSFIDFKIANESVFEEIVQSVDLVVSEWSTALYEATLYDKVSITTSINGFHAYKKFIDRGDILYVKNYMELIAKIENLFHSKNHK